MCAILYTWLFAVQCTSIVCSVKNRSLGGRLLGHLQLIAVPSESRGSRRMQYVFPKRSSACTAAVRSSKAQSRSGGERGRGENTVNKPTVRMYLKVQTRPKWRGSKEKYFPQGAIGVLEEFGAAQADIKRLPAQDRKWDVTPKCQRTGLSLRKGRKKAV